MTPHILATTCAIIALLAVILAVFFFRQLRILRRKNELLVREISEITRMKTSMGEQGLQPHSDECAINWQGEEIIIPPTQSCRSDNSAELAQYICSVIIRERLYLNTQFDRQAAIDYFHLSKERIGAAFSQGSEFPTIADFINHCRLEYAKELLAVTPEMTVDDIASASGFATRRTFSRLFKERYSITPTEYRQQLASR